MLAIQGFADEKSSLHIARLERAKGKTKQFRSRMKAAGRKTKEKIVGETH
jgi:hypothetical protein